MREEAAMAHGIPSLEPDGIRSVAVRGHRPRDKTPRRYRPESERLAAEPWRSSGYGQEYRRARELCIDRARGRCERCGRTVAVKSRGKWRVERGEVHHEVPLAEGGGCETLRLLCIPCHRAVDAELRRARRGG